MNGWAERSIEPLLAPSSTAWQPADFLPDAAQPDFLDRVQALRAECTGLPADYWVVLVGDMVTEEALPSYMSMLNRMDGIKDPSGGDPGVWARWNRAWTSEENRHGDLLNKLLYLSGAVDMRAVEVSIQRLIGSGFDPQLGQDPYRCFVYTSFQERATKISHHNTARLAREHGAPTMASICTTIAGDEARHEAAYQRIVDELLRRDADRAVLAFAGMMRASIVMPAHLLEDGGAGTPGGHEGPAAGESRETAFFKNFAALADSLGVYTAQDYAQVTAHLLKRWRIADVKVSSGAAAEAQEYLVKQEARMFRMAAVHAERAERQRRRNARPRFACDWVFGQEVQAK